MRALTHFAAWLAGTWLALERWFLAEVDPRAYAAVRIGYSLSASLILLDFWPLRHVLLASSGLFGGATDALPRTLNVFHWARSESAVTAVFVVTGLAIVSLGLGFLPRLSAFITYLWALSFAETTPIALSGFDAILRVVGFVLVISPTVRTWSLAPRWAAGSERPPARYGLRMIQWQLMLIYVSTVWLKAPDEFWRRGEAITYFMMSIFARFPGFASAGLGATGAALTYGTLIIEATVPFLLWLRHTRWLGVFLGVSLHVGIAAVSRLELFSVAILAMYPAFLDGEDLDDARRWLSLWTRPAPGQGSGSTPHDEPPPARTFPEDFTLTYSRARS